MKSNRGSWRPLRRDELRDELVHDAYKSQKKLAEPTQCPACQRVHDHFPAGYVVLKGAFLAGHREEVLQLARNREAKEKAEHPLERIMDIEEIEGGVQITTTDTHLARDIGEALHSAYRGELEYHYNKEENLLRVHWAR